MKLNIRLIKDRAFPGSVNNVISFIMVDERGIYGLRKTFFRLIDCEYKFKFVKNFLGSRSASWGNRSFGLRDKNNTLKVMVR